MPPQPGSPFADLPLRTVAAPDGTTRRVVSLRLSRPKLPVAGRHRLTRGEGIDLLAQRYYGAEGLWWRILDANPLVHPLDLVTGDLLDLPEQGPATRATRARGF
jgi:hypothetical protein